MKIKFIQAIIDEIRGKTKELFVDYVELTITTKCTLCCKDCWHLIPRYLYTPNTEDKFKHYSLNEMNPTIDKFLDSVDRVGHFCLLGGEPFLNKEAHLIMQKLIDSKKVEEVHIITNGTLLPSNELLETLQNHKCTVAISDYGDLSIKKQELIELLKDKGIKILIRPCDEGCWYNTRDPEENCNRSKEELKDIFASCTARCCQLIVNNKIYICPRIAHSVELGVYKGNDAEYVDLEKYSVRKTRKLLNKMYELEHLYGCNYCKGNKGDLIPAAIQLKKEDIVRLKEEYGKGV